MHNSVLAFAAKVIEPEDVAGKTVLEVGSAMINGSVRPQLEAMGPASYTGVDLAAGPGVDVVLTSGVEGWAPGRQYDLVVSCEMLEHAEHWQSAFRRMCDLVAPGGALVLTCRGLGFPYHNPPDHWRFEPSDLWRAAVLCDVWPVVCQADPQVPGVFLRANKLWGRPLQPHAENLIGDWPVVRPSPNPYKLGRS